MPISRNNHKIIEKSIKTPFITAILGPRRVGKSTFINQFKQNHPDYLWVQFNMDYLSEREDISTHSLETLISQQAKQHIGGAQKIWVIIDEAQKHPALFDQIKILYDAYKDKEAIKFILSGSAILSLHQLSAETLAGRIQLFHLYEFTLRESAKLIEETIPKTSILDDLLNIIEPDKLAEKIHTLKPFKGVLCDQLETQIIWGGLPEVLQNNMQEDKILYLNNYLQTYLEKDIHAINTITDLPLYKNLMTIIAEQTGSVRNDTLIKQALHCGINTLNKYRGFLASTLMYQEVYPYIGSSLKRLVKSPKGYLLNNGIINILTGTLDINILESTGLIGHRLENWFLNELNTLTVRTLLPTSIQYWRTSSGAEVDFVVTKNPKVLPIEVTHSRHKLNKKIKNLSAFLSDEPKADWGVYLYHGEFDIDHKHKIIYLPCWSIS